MQESGGRGVARDVRARFREAERESSRLRLLQAACTAVAVEGDARAALRSALVHALRFVAADAGAVLHHEAGGLTVQAAHGPALPVGARLPLAGALRAAMQAPVQVRERTVSPVRVGGGAAAVEIAVPLRVHGDAVGLLVLSSARAVALPDEADLATLQALGALLAAVSHQRPAPRVARASRRDAAASIARLTPREQQVFALLPRGLSNAEMALQLGIATGTAKVHVERILHKLGLRDRTQAAVRAAEWGLGK